MRVASFDLGTNSTRFLLAEADAALARPRIATLRREMTITRLGEGVDRSGMLAPGAIERTLDALSAYREIIEDLGGAERYRVAGTSAMRDAANAQALIDGVRDVLDVDAEIVTGEVEARLSFLGAGYDIEGAENYGRLLVVDIGGGSTEIIIGRGSEIDACFSVPVGCVRMSERFLTGDPPGAAELAALRDHVEEAVREPVTAARSLGFGLMVGLAGTVTTLSGINLGLDSYEGPAIHHSRLAAESVDRLFARMSRQTLGERQGFMKLEPGRADVILGGTAVLAVLMRALEVSELLVSEKDILDGLVIDALGSRRA
ncbi:MAG: Ppx/GppA phosphatase family protein [Candidatus Geothermincolia bacterium]